MRLLVFGAHVDWIAHGRLAARLQTWLKFLTMRVPLACIAASRSNDFQSRLVNRSFNTRAAPWTPSVRLLRTSASRRRSKRVSPLACRKRRSGQNSRPRPTPSRASTAAWRAGRSTRTVLSPSTASRSGARPRVSTSRRAAAAAARVAPPRSTRPRRSASMPTGVTSKPPMPSMSCASMPRTPTGSRRTR